MAKKDDEPKNGYLYLIQAEWDSDTTYWPKAYFDGEYYDININGSSPISSYDLQNITADNTLLAEGTSGQYTAYIYKAKNDCGVDACSADCDKAHTHGTTCFGCGKAAHTHSAACKNVNAPYMEFVEADQDVLVEGDGSTIVNVYYEYKIYTVRFIYAKKEGSNYYIATSTSDGQLDNCTWTYAGNNANILPTVDDPSGKNERQSVVINGDTYYYISLSAKYGENIESLWPDANVGTVGNYSFGSWGAEYGSGYRNKYGNAHANIVGPYPVMSVELMVEGRNQKLEDGTYLAQNFIAWWGGTGDNVSYHNYHIYYEVFSDQKEDPDVILFDGRYYKLDRELTFTAAHNGTTRVDPFYYNGHTIVESQKNGYSDSKIKNYPCDTCTYCNSFFYNRNTNKFAFYNFNAVMDGKGDENAAYGTPLSEYRISADDMQNNYYPNNLEPNAYEFGGWYTTPECFPGTEVNWDTLTMPDGDLTLYAKWTPVVRNVTFHLLYTDIDKGVYWYPSEVTDAEKPGYYPLKVSHGQLLGTTYSHIPTRGSDYQFIGWFYFDENGKKKFAPDSMKITRDLVLFAEWLSTIPTTYEVNYEAWDDKTKKKIEDIADKLEGYSTAGKTTTFNAKGGTALYDKVPPNSTSTTYQKQWFPEHSSHSILMDEDSSKNTHTFKYYYKEYINYKVIHIDRATGTILHESEVKRTSNAIVTEKFMPFQDYLPESYYIEKAIAYDPTDYTQYPDHVQPENIIYFYYNEDTGHDPFRVEHYYQELDGTTWTLKFSENGIADNGATISRNSRNDTGFEFSYYTITTYTQNGSEWEKNIVEGKSLPATGQVSVHGMEIKFYYTRKLVDYTVKYVEYGSNPEKVLYTDIIKKQKKFGEEVSVTAVTDFKDGEQTYIHVEGIDSSAEDRTLTKEMRENAEDNVFVFYYNLKTFDIFYHVVCSAPGSAGLNGVSVSKQTGSVLNDSVRSTALVGTGFKFVGWFRDEACTDQITDAAWLADEGKTIVPQGISDEEHYYAKFELISGSLKIIKAVANPDADTANQSFLFHIKGQDARNSFVDTVVSINGEGWLIIADLPVGDYQVTELTGWSWEYTAAVSSYTVTIEADTQSTTTFTNTDNNSNWLNGEASNENVFN